MRIRTSILTLALILPLAGCSDWERTAFQTLSASKSVIDVAAKDYEARTLPHTTCVKDLIEKARAADSDAVRAMGVYEVVKHSTGASAATEQAVDEALFDLAPVVASIQTLSTKPCYSKASVDDTDWPVIVGTSIVREVRK